MANLITLLRLLLLFLIVIWMFFAPPWLQFGNVLLLIIIIVLDGLDGIIARARNEETPFGSAFDIAADRVVELVLWVSFAYLRMIPFWVPVVIITRGVLVDGLRNRLSGPDCPPFGIMHSALGKFLVAGRFMRMSFGALKLITFAWLLFIRAFALTWPTLETTWRIPLHIISLILVYLTVAVCLLRGIPVLLEVSMAQYKKNRGTHTV